MSQTTPPPGQPGQPSPEQMQAALAQLRGAPLTDVLIDIVQGLLSAAQVKVGRRDGRVLLDLVATVTDQTEGTVDPQLTEQVRSALTQLRMAQVEAEQDIAASGEEQPNDLPAGNGARPATPSSPAAAEDVTSRLWIPGR